MSTNLVTLLCIKVQSIGRKKRNTHKDTNEEKKETKEELNVGTCLVYHNKFPLIHCPLKVLYPSVESLSFTQVFVFSISRIVLMVELKFLTHFTLKAHTYISRIFQSFTSNIILSSTRRRGSLTSMHFIFSTIRESFLVPLIFLWFTTFWKYREIKIYLILAVMNFILNNVLTIEITFVPN